jgi:hypothetical protein
MTKIPHQDIQGALLFIHLFIKIERLGKRVLAIRKLCRLLVHDIYSISDPSSYYPCASYLCGREVVHKVDPFIFKLRRKGLKPRHHGIRTVKEDTLMNKVPDNIASMDATRQHSHQITEVGRIRIPESA